MKPKDFIKNVIIGEYRDIVFRHPYLSFALISIAIEFLGKCMLINHKTWLIKPETAFKRGVDLLSAVDSRYSTVDLKELRNGFAHTLVPKKVALSELKHGAIQFDKDSKGRPILVAEIIYRDLVVACQKVINTEFSESDKMNKDILSVGK
jgi:hypothetical protein